jgi:hypothetical protein
MQKCSSLGIFLGGTGIFAYLHGWDLILNTNFMHLMLPFLARRGFCTVFLACLCSDRVKDSPLWRYVNTQKDPGFGAFQNLDFWTKDASPLLIHNSDTGGSLGFCFLCPVPLGILGEWQKGTHESPGPLQEDVRATAPPWPPCVPNVLLLCIHHTHCPGEPLSVELFLCFSFYHTTVSDRDRHSTDISWMTFYVYINIITLKTMKPIWRRL